MPDDVDTFELLESVELRERDGEDQFEVFPTIQRYSRGRHLEFLGHAQSLDIDR